MGDAFDQNRERQHVTVGADQQQIERAIVTVGLKEPVEAEQRRQQGADPQHGRTDPRQQIEVSRIQEALAMWKSLHSQQKIIDEAFEIVLWWEVHRREGRFILRRMQARRPLRIRARAL